MEDTTTIDNAASRPVSTADPALGVVVGGRYEVVNPLGSGGMGVVYEARHRTTGRRVALKLLRGDRPSSANRVERFSREARILGALRSPHIAEVLDAGTDDTTGVPFLAMEFVDGIDLSRFLLQRGKLPSGVALHIALQVASGLAAAHRAGIVHRDVKPANVRLTTGPNGELIVKVLDFGIAKNSRRCDSKLTFDGHLVGSPRYMAPELFRGCEAEARSDVWAVGVLLFECLTGRMPHDAVEIGEIARHVTTFEFPDVRRLAPDVPASVAAIVERAGRIDAGQRYASADEMREAIEALFPPGLAVLANDIEAGMDLPVETVEATFSPQVIDGPRIEDRSQLPKVIAGTLSILAVAILGVRFSGASAPASAREAQPVTVVPEPSPVVVSSPLPAAPVEKTAPPPMASRAPIRVAKPKPAVPAKTLKGDGRDWM